MSEPRMRSARKGMYEWWRDWHVGKRGVVRYASQKLHEK